MQLEINHLVKSFGALTVLSDVSFAATSGHALGLLGRNGAGKTTTIRIIMDVFPSDGGSIRLDGQILHDADVSIGYMPEEKGLYPKVRICDQLIYIAELRGMRRKQAQASVIHWLERLEMIDYLNKKLEVLSKGNQQKIQLAVAMLADPDIIILDEPFSGLDPVNAQLLKVIVREQVQAGKIVLFSSHQMNYVEEFCDDIAVLHHGQIVVSGSLREIKRSYPRNRIAVSLAPEPADSATLIRQYLPAALQNNLISSIKDMAEDGCQVDLYQVADRDRFLQALVEAGLSVEQFRINEPSLEDIFIHVTEEDPADAIRANFAGKTGDAT